MSTSDWWVTAFLAVGALSGALFMIIYTKRTRWWDEEHRVHLAVFTLSLTVIMAVYLLRPFLDPTTFRVIRAPLFIAVVLCMVWRLVLLLRSKKADRVRTDREDAVREVP